MKLDFEELFGACLSALIEQHGGSMEAALDDITYTNEEEKRNAIKNWFGWETEFEVKVYDIDYCIDEEDLEANDFDVDEMSEDEIEAAIQKIVATLPKELVLTVECTEDALEDVLVDAISEETGWLINNFQYEIIN